jgi:thiol-disulfide isomerase/thioredoxin
MKVTRNQKVAKTLLAFLAVIVVVSIALCACSKESDKSGKANELSDGKKEEIGWGEIPFSTTTLSGDKFTVEDFKKNKLTVVNFWATWCDPCVEELPALEKLNTLFSDKNVAIVGVLQDGIDKNGKADDKAIGNAIKLLENAEANYDVILPDAILQENFLSRMQYLPTTLFFDQNGNILKTLSGANNLASWQQEVQEVLDEIDKD